jgi:hypothetical protein
VYQLIEGRGDWPSPFEEFSLRDLHPTLTQDRHSQARIGADALSLMVAADIVFDLVHALLLEDPHHHPPLSFAILLIKPPLHCCDHIVAVVLKLSSASPPSDTLLSLETASPVISMRTCRSTTARRSHAMALSRLMVSWGKIPFRVNLSAASHNRLPW